MSVSGRRKRLCVAGVAVAAVVGVLASCSSTGTNAAGPTTTAGAGSGDGPASVSQRIFGPEDTTEVTPGGRLVMGVEAETEAMDTGRVPLAASGYFLASAVFDSLATLDKDGKPVPFLAKSIESSNDAKTWTITLPTDVTFHNGDVMTSEDVKDVFEFYKASAITSAFFRTVSSIDAPTPDTVVVRLSESWVAFPVMLTTQVGYVMHPSMIDDPELAYTPIGTGPFKFESHEPNVSWSLNKNPDYWRKDAQGRQLPYLDGLEIRARVDEDTRLKEFDQGDLDLIHTVKPLQVLALREMTDIKRVEYSDGEKDFLTINTEEAPFDDVDARRAMAFAIDTEKWRSEITKGVKEPLASPFGPTQPGGKADSGYPMYDPTEAKKLVAAYEAKHGKPLEFEYIAGDDPSDSSEAQLLASMLTEVGMKVTINALPQAQLIAHVVTGTYQVSMWRNFGMPDPDADTIWWRSESVLPRGGVSLNTARFKDKEIDSSIDKALAATTPEDREAAYAAIAKRMGAEVPYVWLGRVVWNLAANPRVNGIYPAANGSIQTLGEKSWMSELWLQR